MIWWIYFWTVNLAEQNASPWSLVALQVYTLLSSGPTLARTSVHWPSSSYSICTVGDSSIGSSPHSHSTSGSGYPDKINTNVRSGHNFWNAIKEKMFLHVQDWIFKPATVSLTWIQDKKLLCTCEVTRETGTGSLSYSPVFQPLCEHWGFLQLKLQGGQRFLCFWAQGWF